MERNYYTYNGRIRGLGQWAVDIPKKVLLGHHREGGLLFGKDVTDELIIPAFYLYEENNKFYEFFSGEYLGTRKGDSLIREPIGLFLTKFGYDYGTLDYDINNTPTTSFAKSAKEFQERAEKLCKMYHTSLAEIMKKQIKRIDLMYYEHLEKVAASEKQAKKAEEESQSWLDSYINNR